MRLRLAHLYLSQTVYFCYLGLYKTFITITFPTNPQCQHKCNLCHKRNQRRYWYVSRFRTHVFLGPTAMRRKFEDKRLYIKQLNLANKCVYVWHIYFYLRLCPFLLFSAIYKTFIIIKFPTNPQCHRKCNLCHKRNRRRYWYECRGSKRTSSSVQPRCDGSLWTGSGHLAYSSWCSLPDCTRPSHKWHGSAVCNPFARRIWTFSPGCHAQLQRKN